MIGNKEKNSKNSRLKTHKMDQVFPTYKSFYV